MYKYKNEEVSVCDGNKCIHRFRCYRHLLFQDLLFKGFEEANLIDVDNCINPTDDDTMPYQHMWLPELPTN